MTPVVLTSADSVVEVVPERGAIVTRIAVEGRDLLYLDRATLEDPAKNVRGGIPVLLPFAGRLVDDRFLAGPTPTTMKQHGFGRNLPWHPRHGPRAADHLDLGLGPDETTRAVYPFEFVFFYRVQALPRGVSLDLLVKNQGKQPLPVAPGWHPYFACPAARKGEVGADVPGWDASRLGDAAEFDFGLALPARTTFELPELGALSMEVSDNLGHLQLWSLPGKPFVCLEPFAGPANHINTAARDDIPAGGQRHYWVKLTLGT